MKKTLTRRDMIGRAGLAIGGAMTLGVLQGCGEDESCAPAVDNAAKLTAFPYEQHLAADFQLDKAAVQEAAYHGYYDGGGCGHGSWAGLLGDLARAGEPFTQLPVAFGAFGGGGIAAYGSICGAALSGVLIVNSVVANAGARGAMMTELMRWYESHAFPAYVPQTVNAAEAGATKLLDWGSEPTKPAVTPVAPGSHLCHASVSGWCAAQDPMVNAGGASQVDKKCRCARVTADCAGKVVDMVNAYLASGAFGARSFTAQAAGTDVTGCTSCHGTAVGVHQTNDIPASASGMSCTTCHGEKLPLDGATHAPAAAGCTDCHTTI